MSSHLVPHLNREDLLRDFQFERISHLLPDLLRTFRDTVVVKALEMEYQNGWQCLYKDLFGGSCLLPTRGVKIAMHALRLGKILQCVDDVIDVWCTNVELQGLVGFQRDRIFAPCNLQF